MPGSIILGQVTQINTHDVALALPNNLTGYLPITAISGGMTERVEALVEDDDEDGSEDGGEELDGPGKDDVDLNSTFFVGQYLRARVSSTHHESSVGGVSKGKRRIELCTDPRLANEGLSKAELVVNNMVQASVVSVEDHGLVMDFGLDDSSVRGFMSSREIARGLPLSSIRKGAVFLCLVIGHGSNGNIIKLSANPHKFANLKKTPFLSNAPTVDAFLPGTTAEILITEVGDAGIAGKVMGMLDVTADLIHCGASTEEKWDKKFKVGQKIKGRITCTFPTVEPKKLGFSLLEHVLTLSPLLAPTETESKDPVDVLPLSTPLPQATVVRVVPGLGLLLDVGVHNIPAFVHISRVADKKIETLSASTGPYKLRSTHPARIIGYNPIDGLYLASMEHSILEQPFLRVEDVKVGRVVKGTVEKLVVNASGVGGLLVKLADGVTGLVQEMHMADVKLSHPERKFREGLAVTARVLSTDPERRHLRLTLKKTLVNSDAPVLTCYKDASLTTQCPGTIVKILPSGAVVQFYGSVRAFLPVSEMSEAYIEDPSHHFRVGQVVNVRVLSVDADSQKMTVSCRDRAELGLKQASALESINIGNIVAGKVTAKSNDDVTIELRDSNLKATVRVDHLTDGSEQKNSSAMKKIRVGQQLTDLVVLQKNEDKRSITLSNKPSLVEDAEASKLIKAFEDLRKGSTVKGFVNNVTSSGVFVQFGGALTGLLPKRELSDDALLLPDFGLRRHQSISVTVLSIDHGQQRFIVSMKGNAEPRSDATEATKKGPDSADDTVVNAIDPNVTTIEDLTLGKITKARIASIKDTQINVQLADNVQGRIDVSSVFDSWDDIKDRKQPLRRFNTKDVVSVRILGVHDARNHRFLPITHRAGRVPVFELSARPSDLVKANAEMLTLDKVKVASTWIAFVNNIASDCIWVNLTPNVRGRLRHLDVSEDVSLLKDVHKNFPVGSALKVHATHVDVATNRLDLSARSVNSSNTSGFDSLAKGMVIPGRVTKVTERHVMVQLNDLASGPVSLTDLADDYSLANPTTYTKNEIVRVCVTDLDLANKRVFLSTRPSRVLNSSLSVKDPEVFSISQLKVNDILRGFVKNVADNGLFVSLSRHVTAYIRVSDLSDSFIKDWKSRFQVDQLVRGKVVAVDRLLNHVQMSLRSSVIDQDYVPPITFTDMKVGQVVTGTIRKTEDFGVFIVVDNSTNVSGLCHRSEIADQKVEDVKKLYKEADAVKAKVLKVEPEKRRISFGLKVSYFEALGDDEDEDGHDGMNGMALANESDADDDGEEAAESGDGGADLDTVQDFIADDGRAANQSAQSTESRAVASAMRAISGLQTGGFDWTASILDQGNKHTMSESADEAEPDQMKRKKRRKPKIKIDRTGNLDAHGPQSSDDFERLLLGQPDSSYLWLQYMAFQLQLSELAKAREIAERALQSIDMREETEKMNVWIGLLNLENTYGSDDTVEEVFKRACQYNDAQEIHERLASIYIQSGKTDVSYTSLLRNPSSPHLLTFCLTGHSTPPRCSKA